MISDEVLLFLYDKETDTHFLNNAEAIAFAEANGIPRSAVGDDGYLALVAACEGKIEIQSDDWDLELYGPKYSG